jgi:methionyl-tRNA formyltransferase
VRAVAPPYPGAFTELGGERFVIARARLAPAPVSNLPPGLQVEDNALLGVCGDGRALAIHELRHEGHAIDPAAFASLIHSSRHT